MISLFATAATLSLLSRFSYSSRLDSVRRFAFGVLLFSVVASPFIKGLSELVSGGIDGILPPESTTDGESQQIYEDSFCMGVRDAVCEKFKLKTGEVRVLAEEFSLSGWEAEKIRIILSGMAALSDYHEIEKYINNLEIGECVVEIEIG